MNKIKETIKQLESLKEHCKSVQDIDECTDHTLHIEAIDTAVEMVERQIPKKPDMYGDGYDDDGNMIYDTYNCPNCNTNYEIDYDGKHKFCSECGQAIDWSEVENV